MSEQKQFYTLLDTFESKVNQKKSIQDEALSLKNDFIAKLLDSTETLSSEELKDSNPSAVLLNFTRETMRKNVNHIEQKWSELLDRQQLAQIFNQKLIILVFGKVNSGKSSFANLFVEQYTENNPEKSVQYFYLEAGEKVSTEELFAVGSTETTSRIQGVELGNLVLLDTPGLHSVTDENGELTRKFTDSADLVLWLTNSGSPGQIQELNELQVELRKQKPLLPVITKSDTYDEDEVDGEIVSELVMKSDADRILQQNDVLHRTKEKIANMVQDSLGGDHMLKPISISAHYAKSFHELPETFTRSGFNDLYNGLNSTFQTATDYKVDKFNHQVKYYLSEIVNLLKDELLDKALSKTVNELKSQREIILKQISTLTSQVKGSIFSKLPDLIAKHEKSKDVQALNLELEGIVKEEITQILNDFVKQYFKTFNESIQYVTANIEGYKDVTHSYEVESGQGAKAVSGVIGGATGTGIALALGPVGWFIGAVAGVVGMFIGNGVGNAFVDSETVTSVIGVDSSKVQRSIEKSLNKGIPAMIENALDSVLASLMIVEQELDSAINLTTEFIGKVKAL